MSQETQDRWVIVLAGGEGDRMRALTEARYGGRRPKQYCSFTGGRTMIEHTYDRALDAAPPERIVTIIGRGHARYLLEPRLINVPGLVIEQPENLDTGPGVFLPLAKILAFDPDAT